MYSSEKHVADYNNINLSVAINPSGATFTECFPSFSVSHAAFPTGLPVHTGAATSFNSSAPCAGKVSLGLNSIPFQQPNADGVCRGCPPVPT